MPKGKKKGAVKKSSSLRRNKEKVLVDNFISLQKVMVTLSTRVDDLTKKISGLLELFEVSAKTLAEKDIKYLRSEEIKDIIEKMNTLLDQNKIIARGLTLVHERVSESEANESMRVYHPAVYPPPVNLPPQKIIPPAVKPVKQAQKYYPPAASQEPKSDLFPMTLPAPVPADETIKSAQRSDNAAGRDEYQISIPTKGIVSESSSVIDETRSDDQATQKEE